MYQYKQRLCQNIYEADNSQKSTSPKLCAADLHSTAMLSLQVDKIITLEQLVGELRVADA